MKSFMTDKLMRAAIVFLFSTVMLSCGSKEEEKVEAEKQLQAVKIKDITLQPFQDNYIDTIGIVRAVLTTRLGSTVTEALIAEGAASDPAQLVAEVRAVLAAL